MSDVPSDSETLAFYQTAPHRCSYLPGNRAVTLFADPAIRKNPTLQKVLSEHGFRRSGELLYRPRCPACNACTAVRLPVAQFTPNRAQRRTWSANQDLIVQSAQPQATEEYLDLYCRYLGDRHTPQSADESTAASFLDFLTAAWSDTCFYEFRLAGNLLAVAVVDRWTDALSAVYTFFDPTQTKRSLGRFAVLYEIQEARRLGLDWLYLGYWIDACRKMQYKREYQPLEYFIDEAWRSMPDDTPA
jgi:leucyl-tRNA---protein transferase